MLPERQNPDKSQPAVLCCRDTGTAPLCELFGHYGLRVVCLEVHEPIPGSHWGEPEAGLIGHTLYVRPDTPLHSALHEGSHYICMSPERRMQLHTDAGGDDLEEAAVCYLQMLLADRLPGVGHHRLAQDMDTWGYTFRLGSTQLWFMHDADDAREWLILHRILPLNEHDV